MKSIRIPSEPKKIIDKLSENGYEAYIVGGCVRDNILGREPEDYDITTSALPEDVKRIFDKTVDTGIKHGTVTVIENGNPYEVTTYRIDGEYKDNRHPVSITYTDNIVNDLARRDFTVNAMAYNSKNGLLDAFGGSSDLTSKQIRCVGEPSRRFDEDALRVLRGIRFASSLGFDIEPETKKAIMQYAPRLKSISSERIFTEWKKLLLGVRAYDVICEYFDVIKIILPELDGANIPCRDVFDGLLWDERQIALFALSSGSIGFLSAMNRLKIDSKTRDTGVSVLNNLKSDLLKNGNDLRAFLVGKNDEIAMKSVKLAEKLSIAPNGSYEEVKRLIDSNSIRSLSQLAIGGRELVDIGYKGESVGKILNEMLMMCATKKIDNTSDALISYARSRIC